MLQQATTSFLRCLSAIGLLGLRTSVLLSLSLILAACGSKGDRPTVEFVVEKDGKAPTLGEFTVTNKCNFTPRIALNDKILVRIDASESLMKPVVTILGEEVVISGQNHQWSGEFELTDRPDRPQDEVVSADVIEFIKNKTSSPIVEVSSVFTAESGLNLSTNEMSELVKSLESEFKISLPDPELQPGLINTVQQVINVIQSTDLEIPVTVSFQDISGEVGSYEIAENKILKFCEQNCKCFPDDISGTWENRNEVNAMGVGPEEGSTIFWNINNFELGRRGCVFDDEYLFGPEDDDIDDTGSFSQSMGDETWLESWISPDGKETCGAPIAPFDGSGTDHTYIWDPENKQLTVKGLGAHIGIPRIQNESSAQNETVEKIIYNVSTASTCILILDIKGAENWWHFELEKIKDANGDEMTPAKCDAVGGSSGGADADETLDTDGDGVPDYRDMFPNDSTESLDTDFDGIGNNADTDDDGDGKKDSVDCAPLDKNVKTCASGSGSGSGSGSSDGSASSGFDLTNATAVPVVIQDQFGGAFISDSGSYSVPAGSETWAGFTVVPDTEDDGLPLTFGSGGQITFNANVDGNSNVDVRFRFEKAASDGDDVTPTVPSYTIESENLSSGEGEYTINIPPQGSKTFSSMIFYIDAQNVSLSLSDIVIKETPAAQGSEVGPLVFAFQFDGAVIPGDSEFLMPTGNPAAGFSIDKTESGANTDANPLYFGNGGYITFVGSVPDGGDVDVKFEVQFDEYPNTTPNYMTDVVTVSGAGEKNYSVSIPEQFDNGYKMVIAWLETFDTTVVMKEIMVGVTAQGAAKVGATGTAQFTNAFHGAVYAEETNTYTYPSGSSVKSYAGFGNMNEELYPFTFDNGGCVTFNASAENAVRIRYKFERLPYINSDADTKPDLFTDYGVISGTTQEYKFDVPSSAAVGNSYSSFLLFINGEDRDLPLVVTDVVATNTGACGTD
jgi:acyl carrier protein